MEIPNDPNWSLEKIVMRMFTFRTNQLSNQTASAISLVDTLGNLLACNYIECWPTKDGVGQGILLSLIHI